MNETAAAHKEKRTNMNAKPGPGLPALTSTISI